MKMGKEFYEILEFGQKSNTASQKMLAAGDIEMLMEDYPRNGYKWKSAKKAVDSLRESAEKLRKERIIK